MPLPPRLLRFRRPVIVLVHMALVAAANYLAFWLRFDGAIPPLYVAAWSNTAGCLVMVRAFTFVPFRLYEGLWRYTGIWDLKNIIQGVGASSVLFYVLIQLTAGPVQYPRSIFLVDSVLLIFFMSGIRLIRRFHREIWHLHREKRVLIFGAGDAGEMIVRDIRNNAFYEYQPIGFVDDDPAKLGRLIHGVRVLGARTSLDRIMRSERVDEVLVAIPRAEPAVIRAVVRALEPYKIPIKTLPNLRDIMNGRVTVSEIRNLAIEDLLARAPIGLDPAPLRTLIAGKRVVVTGAGGSIGSELCRQVLALRPAALVLYERYENSLYTILNELQEENGSASVHGAIGDVTDVARLNAVFAEHQPDIVFHAAAHKHVPLMEENPCEAVKNNVVGTKRVAEAAHRHGVKRFILISSDKAVNPSSVMGATKRVAELIVREMSVRSATEFVSVRFGNVLGSNGSVVLRFLDQIRTGGPVTVTDPEVRRYFMLVSEAVQLVLHAAALGEHGAIYVLEMGEQIKLLDMARDLIRLSGFIPEEEICIRFVGLRPGEKLHEELVGRDEEIEPSAVAKVSRVRGLTATRPNELSRGLVTLERLANAGDSEGAILQLREIVPAFTPASNVPEESGTRGAPLRIEARAS